MTVNERIRARRKELGLSADQVAEALNVSRSTVFRYESSEIEKLPTSVLEPLCKILKTTPANLMGWEADEKLGMVLESLSKIDDDEIIDIFADMANMSKDELNKFKTTYRIIKSNI